ncbi:hypothetical protein V1264_005190 [Littorina saxatilis]|uniref:Uncharacterized protein n=2 Tax=Littorina saxatilis TaxID=31220 RepID=A0AAN9G6N5_9CAEN
MLTMYDPGYSLSDDSRENMEKRMSCFSNKIAGVLENQLRGCCSFDFTILPLTLSKQQWTEDNLKHNVEKMQQGADQLTTGMYQNIKAAATSLTGVSYVPYILNKYKEEQTEDFSEQKHLTLMERDWRAALSLMIEALSFQKGDCHITYTSDNEYKVKVAALEAARRWALIQDVVFVADDFLNNGYVQGHTDLCYRSGDDDSERLQLSMQTPMEPHDSCAKYVFLDSDYLSAGAGLPSLSDIARKDESVASSVTSWGSKHRKHFVDFESSTGSKSKSSVDGDFPDLADVRVTQAEV